MLVKLETGIEGMPAVSHLAADAVIAQPYEFNPGYYLPEDQMPLMSQFWRVHSVYLRSWVWMTFQSGAWRGRS